MLIKESCLQSFYTDQDASLNYEVGEVFEVAKGRNMKFKRPILASLNY
jgi:hypothetical protein